jgi:hypothetical protein
MQATMPDTLKVYDILKEAQIPEPQARAITRAIQESEKTVATDFREVLSEKLEHFATKADLASLEARLMRWMFVFWVGQLAGTVGIVFAAFKLWR